MIKRIDSFLDMLKVTIILFSSKYFYRKNFISLIYVMLI